MYGDGDYSSMTSTMTAMPMGDMMTSRMDVWEELLPGMNGEPVGEQVTS